MNPEARRCIRALLRRKESVHIFPQNIFEFWVVATRPVANNGLGLSLEEVKRKVRGAEFFFRLTLDNQAIYGEWLRLVDTYSVLGLNGHDARLVAAMKVHGLSHIITFNTRDFERYKGTEVSVVTPAEVIHSLSASS